MIKQFAKYIGEYRKETLLSPLFIILEVFMEVLIPFLIAFLIDNGISQGDMGTIIKIGTLLLIAAFIAMFFGIQAGKYSAIASTGFGKNLRKGLYYKIQEFSFSNIDKFSTSSLITRLTTDVTNIQNAFLMLIRIAVRAPVMFFFSIIMAFSISPKLSLVFLAVIPLLVTGLYFVMTKAHPIFRRVFKKYDKLNQVVQENLSGIRVVKSYVRETLEIAKFKDSSKDIFQDFSKAERLAALIGPLMQFCIYSSILLISWFGARMIVAGSLTTGQLISLIAYITQILISLMMVSMVLVMISISRASAERALEVLNEEVDLKNPENPVKKVKTGDVRFENVSFSYKKDKKSFVLKNVNFDVKEGEMVGIIGGTGSSKTSLVQLIPRLYDVTEGRVLVGGIDVRDYDIHALRDSVAMVLQKNVLFSGTIKENLRWGDKHASNEEIRHASQLAQADEFIQRFPDKYDTYIEQGGTNVSGGQKQRLTIARALLKKPKILILDDSTSAVDTKTDARICSALRKELPNTTKIIIAQRISSIMDADKIIVLEQGEINGIGTHEELLKNNDIYRDIYNSQMKGGRALDA